jgi:hypothetical protein
MTRKKNPKRKRPRCEKKIRYYDECQAYFTAGIMTQKYGTKFNAYYCKIHKCWHVGHEPYREVKGFPRAAYRQQEARI